MTIKKLSKKTGVPADIILDTLRAADYYENLETNMNETQFYKFISETMTSRYLQAEKEISNLKNTIQGLIAINENYKRLERDK